MAFQLTYRLTFIDAIEPPAVESLRRSRSLPVLGSTPAAEEVTEKKEPWTTIWVSKNGVYVLPNCHFKIVNRTYDDK